MKTKIKIDCTFPMTETLSFNAKYHFNEDRVIEVDNSKVKRNPKNRYVYFISLEKDDLLQLVHWTNNNKITQNHIDHNIFAVMSWQIVK